MNSYHDFGSAFARLIADGFTFATLCRLRLWKNGRAQTIYQGGRQISVTENPGSLLGSLR